jgi:hypothetical protein
MMAAYNPDGKPNIAFNQGKPIVTDLGLTDGLQLVRSEWGAQGWSGRGGRYRAKNEGANARLPLSGNR